MGGPSHRKSSRKEVNKYSQVPSLADFDSDARSAAGFERFDSLFSKTPAQAQAQTATNSSQGIMFEDGKPTSKTSLGKVYYKLGKLPYLLLIDVDITTTEPAKGQDGEPVLDKNGVSVTQPTMVRSRRLRQQALEEYVEIGSEGLGFKQSEIAFDFEARSNQLDAVQKVWPGIGQCPERPRFGRTNRLIIPVRGKLDVEKVFNKFDQVKGLTRVNKTYSKAEKRADPKNTGWSIRCTVVRQGLLAHPDIKRSDAPILPGSEHSEDTNATDESKDDRIAASTESRVDSSDESENTATDQAKEPSEPDESRESITKMNQDAATALYRHNIQLLFQHRWDSAYPTARLGNTSEFRFTNADLFGQEEIPLIKKSDRHIHQDAPWEYRIRYRPRFDKDLRLFFDYDLVPIIQDGVSVAEYAGYHFPANDPTAPASMSQTLKGLLQGLHVRYPLDINLKENYKNIAKANKWKLIGHVDDQNERKELQNRTYTIRDVKANSDVGLVIPVTKLLSGGGEEKTFLNVKKFLSVCGAPSEAKFRHLPLADIGKNQPFWIPLDLLVFSVDQVLPHLQHLTDELQRLRKSVNPHEMSASGSKLLTILRTDPMKNPETCVFNHDQIWKPIISLPFLASTDKYYDPLKYTTLEPASAPRRAIKSDAPSPRVAVVYITSDVHSRSSNQFLADVRNALIREANSPAQEKILDIGVGSDRISTGAVKSGPELFRLQDGKDLKDLKDIINLTADVLVGIIDDSGLSQAKYSETAAEMKRLGDRKLGAITVCLKKQDLEDRFRRSDEPRFPSNVLRKIRFMLGSMNFETKKLDTHIQEHHGEGLIVIGAHISQPASDATEYCPAVAALVMSKPNNPSFCCSAARLQPATKMHVQAYDNENLPADACKSPTGKTLYQPEIMELEATLRSMFRAWKKDRDESSKANWPNEPRVVFYRDSYHEIDPLAHEREVEHITEAYQNVFTKTEDPPLSYVTVMRNSRVHSPIPEDKQDKDDVCTPHFTFTTSEFAMGDPTRKEDGAKYQYLVHSNGDKSKMTLGKLRDLTGLLNISSQLCHYTSLALPVHYARKLARRVLSYYDYVSHKDISNYPGLAKLTPYDAVTGREQMNEVKQNLQVIAKRSKPWDWVRDNKKEAHIRPWNKKLDDKMFFL